MVELDDSQGSMITVNDISDSQFEIDFSDFVSALDLRSGLKTPRPCAY